MRKLTKISLIVPLLAAVAVAQSSGARTATAPAAGPAQQSPAVKAEKRALRRDPFVNPIQIQEDNARSSAGCATGVRCLVINQTVLKGIVKTPNGMIAMVENAAKKPYTLREKDTVLNGVVLKITANSVVFRQDTIDGLGRTTSKEVVKTVNVPPV